MARFIYKERGKGEGWEGGEGAGGKKKRYVFLSGLLDRPVYYYYISYI